MGKLRKIVLTVLCCVSCIMGMQAQNVPYDPSKFIEVNINSGNPAFPYPQFLEYPGGGKSLAKYNAEGVTHADMEKAGREAYEIMSHRCRYFGGTHCGVKYIVFNPIAEGGTTETTYTYPDVPGAYGTFCSEGDGYMLLAAAIFADQKTYNGLYMWIHDNRFSGIKRFKDGKMFRENKKGFTTCPYLAGWGADETTTSESPCHSATDGDVDIAMATLIAYKQWGEYMMQDGEIVKDANGDPISYLYEAQRCIGALVDTFPQWEYGANTLSGYLPGSIGIDGYTKNGSSWGEVTRWRFSDAAVARYPNINGPYNGGPVLMSNYGPMFVDYDAPSYYDEFYKWFKEDGAKKYDSGITKWRVHQFQKAAASGNWITKKAYEQGKYASIGSIRLSDDGSEVSFGESGLDGEDFRFAWRHLLDYLWHGETAYDWDPKDHSVIEGQSHDGVKLMGIRQAELMKNPPGVGDEPGTGACSKLGASPDAGQPMWSGVVHNPQQYNSDGTIKSFYHTNYSIGSGSPAAVIAEDQEFLNDIYRSLELRWDGNNTDVGAEDEERYMGSTPKYFHGWYRTLGMLVCQGNMHAPADMKPIANMKVYMSVDKTYAYVDDDIEYTVQYRNYGTLDAKGVTITTEIDPNYEVKKINGPGKLVGNKIVWNIGTVPGFKTGGLEATIDSVGFIVTARDTLNPRICLTSTISGDNFPDWVSNEYPNHATYTMERNCVDILASRTLQIEKKASRKIMNPGDVVAFTVNFENKSLGQASWLNGGRDHVRLSYGNYMMSETANLFYQYYRFWNDSYEAYINLGNYRVSYFMYDAASIGLYDESDNPTGWQFELDNGNDMAKYGWMPTGAETKFTYQKMPNGEDEFGKWNQRIMIQFPASLMAPSAYVYDHLNNAFQLHKGGYGPCFFRTRLGIKQAKAMYEKVKDDWSYSKSLAIGTLDGQAETYTLVSPGWADYDNPGYEINNYARHICNPKKVGNYERVLIEEFDGYTWRRIQGTGPLPGREANNVTIIDTIPYELEWVGWKDSTALKDDKGEKIKATYTPAANPKTAGYTGIVKWTTPVMLVGEKDKLIYMCKARDLGCPEAEDTYYMNVAWISSQTDSPDSSRVELMTTCAEVPPVIDEQTCLFKSASVKKAMEGDPVTYTVKFVNNIGTKVDAKCTDAKEWITLGGKSMPEINSKGLVLSKESGAFCAPKYSYGKDGEMYITIEDAANTQSTWVVMRYVSGIPGTSSFKGVAIKMKVNLDNSNNFGYELYNNGTLIEAEGTSWQDVMQFKGSSTKPTFKFVLRGEKLYMYCNDEDDEWENVMKDWSGLTSAGPGYFGVYTERNNGSPTVSKFITELDYAFDINMGDYLPVELTDIDNISNGGTYDATKHTIKWPTIGKTVEEGLPGGDSLVYTFDATVDNCTKYINNMAYATVYGQDSLKVLNTIECGKEPEPECELKKAVATLSADSICEGDSAYIKVATTPKSKNYVYTYIFGKDDELNEKPISVDSFFVKKTGSYSVTVTDTTIKNCYVTSEKVKLIVSELPDALLEPDSVVICEGSDLDISNLEVEDMDITWYTDKNGAFDLPSTKIDADDVLTSYYYQLTDKKTGCKGDVQKFRVEKEAIPDKPTGSNKEYPLTAGAKQNISSLATPAADGSNIIWYNDTDKDSIPTPVYVSLDEEKTFTFYIASVSKHGCESGKDTITVSVTNSNKPVVKDTTICIGEEVDVLTLVTKEDGYSLVWFDEDGNKVSEPESYTGSVPGEKKYYVAQTDGVSVSEKAEITITTMGVASATVEDMTFCAKDATKKAEVTTDAATVSKFVKANKETEFEWWYNGSKLDGAPEPLTDVLNTNEYIYKVVPTYTIEKGHICKGDTVTMTATVTHVDAPVVNNTITYALQDTLPDGTFKNLTSHDENAVKALPGHTLVWYDENGMLIGETSPTPNADRTMTDDMSYTYFVAQKNGDCMSDSSLVSVIVSSTPVPTPTDFYFCEGTVPTETIDSHVKLDNSFTPIWYDGDPKKGGSVLSSAPTISTNMSDPALVEETVTYYVAQTDGTVTSSAVPLNIHIYARPKLKTHFDTVCVGPVSLDTLWEVSKKVTTLYPNYYDEDGNDVDNPGSINKTGNYKVEAYYLVPGTDDKCQSSLEPIYVEIHKIDSLYIVGSKTTCPDSPIELTAKLVGDTYDGIVKYTWDSNNNSANKGNGGFLSDNLSAPAEFTVTVTDGYCTKSDKHKVTIDKGVVDGQITFTEIGSLKDPLTQIANGELLTYYSCGGDVKVTTLLASDKNDFVWDDGTTGTSMTTSAAGTYKIMFTNVCETYQEVKIIVAGIKDNTVGEDLSLCEGEKGKMELSIESSQSYKIEWTKNGEVQSNRTSSTINISSVKTEDAGIYKYKVTNNHECEVSATYGEIQVFPKPKYELIKVDKICAGEQVEIGLSNLEPSTAVVTWTSDPTLIESGISAVAKPNEDKTYKFSITQNGGCEIKESVDVTVDDPIEFDITPTDTAICEGAGSVRLSAVVTKGKTSSYSWTDENGEVLSETPVYKVESSNVGLRTIKLTLANEACGAVSAISNVEITELPRIDTIMQIGYKEAEVVLANNGKSPYEIKADNGDYQSDMKFTELKYGKHTFTVKDAVGCVSSKEVMIEAPDMTIPTLVTPNGDGENDLFISEVMAEAYPDARMRIYDRFGKKIAEVTASEGWDGSYNGVKMPSTDYWYEIWVEEIRKTYTGHFTLINP